MRKVVHVISLLQELGGVQQSFVSYYKYAQKWVETFHANPEMIEKEMPLYLKAVHNSLNALYMAQHHKKFSKGLKLLEDIGEKYYQKKLNQLRKISFQLIQKIAWAFYQTLIKIE